MVSYIFIIGIAQGFLLCFNFFEKGRRSPQYQWLGSLILVATLMIIASWLGHEGLHDEFKFVFLLASGSFFLLGPLLLLFIKSNLKDSENQSKTLIRALHFIPALLFFGLIIFFAKLQGEEVAKEIFKSEYELKINHVNIILPLVKLFHLLIYTVLSIKLVTNLENSIRRLLKAFTASYLFIQFVFWTLFVLSFFYDPKLFQITDFIIGIVIALAIYILGYLSIKQSDILPETISKVIKKRYETSRLTKKESHQYFKTLIVHLDKDEPFLDPDMNLKLLAIEIDVSSHQLSQIINENSSYNFSGLINCYRVNKFKALVVSKKYRHYTLLAIAFEAGFNNKNSFNQAFKKETGKTPSQFLNEILSK